MTVLIPPAWSVPPGAGEIVEVRDPRDMDINSRISLRLPEDIGAHSYRLLDPTLLRRRFDTPIAIHATRRLGDMYVSRVWDRFGTQIDIGGAGLDRYCFTAMTAGGMALARNGREILAEGASGLVLRGLPGTRALTGDNTARVNLWIEATALEGALERLLGERLRRPLDFEPFIDWSTGAGASLRGQIRYLLSELRRGDGLAGNPVALASFTDLALRTIVTGLPHNHIERLGKRRSDGAPAHVRRAEDFIRVNAAAPIRVHDIAAAAGCGERTLSLVFRRFRGTTPLAALHAVRLEMAREEIRRLGGESPTAEIARRFGFTHPARFSTAYRARFDETPTETAGRTPRGPKPVTRPGRRTKTCPSTPLPPSPPPASADAPPAPPSRPASFPVSAPPPRTTPA